jgi:hypothetical protein
MSAYVSGTVSSYLFFLYPFHHPHLSLFLSKHKTSPLGLQFHVFILYPISQTTPYMHEQTYIEGAGEFIRVKEF